MKHYFTRTAVAVAALGACMALATPSLAREGGPEFSANVGITNDYVWRGFSQSDENVAIQGGVDVSYGSFYAGTWASTVDFGDDTKAEWDFYAGVTGTVGLIDWDLGLTYYTYVDSPGGSDYNFVEAKLVASRTFDKVTLGAGFHYSPDFYGADETATYVEVFGEYAISDDWSVSGGFGLQSLDVGADYSTWNVGVGYALNESLSLDVRYWDADISSPLSDPRVSVTLGVGF